VREYELTLIYRPDLGDEGFTSLNDRVQGWVAGAGGEVLNVTTAGRKRLAFPIGHFRDGYYTVMQVRSRPDAVDDVERHLKLSEDVLRHMFIRR
jgi:small subunit ribosomal protein S6